MALRIGVLASTFPRWARDSVPRFVLDFARELQDRGCRVNALTPHFEGARRAEILEGVPVRRFRYWWPASGQSIAYGMYRPGVVSAAKGAAYTVAQVLAAVRLARRSDVLNAHWLVPQGFAAVAAAQLVRRPVVVTVHGGDVFTLGGPLSRAVKTWTLRHADAVVCNSTATVEVCRAMHPRSDYEIVPMGTAAVPDPGPRRVRDATDPLRVLFVGRLAEGKGVADLLEALSEAQSAGVDVSAVIAGDGPLADVLRRRAADLGLAECVRFLGWVDASDLGALYEESDVLVAPSTTTASGWREAFGLVLVEAAMWAIPVIGTRTGGVTDVVTDGVTGYLVDERAPDQIAASLALLAAQPDAARDMGAAARSAALSRFSWDAVMQSYTEILSAVAR